jgi:hypothetical protein
MLLILSSGVALADEAPPQIVHEPCETFQKGVAYEVVARFYDESPIFDPKVVFRKGKGKWQNRPFKRQGDNNNFVAVIPARFLKKGSIEYFIEAFDENGNGPARYGSTDAPVLLNRSAEASTCQQVPDSSPVNFYTGDGSQLPDAPKVEHDTAPASVPTVQPPMSDAQKALTTPVVDQGTGSCEMANAPFYCSPWFWAATTALVAGGGLATYFLTAGGGEAVETGATINLVITSAPNPTGVN